MCQMIFNYFLINIFGNTKGEKIGRILKSKKYDRFWTMHKSFLLGEKFFINNLESLLNRILFESFGLYIKPQKAYDCKLGMY